MCDFVARFEQASIHDPVQATGSLGRLAKIPLGLTLLRSTASEGKGAVGHGEEGDDALNDEDFIQTTEGQADVERGLAHGRIAIDDPDRRPEFIPDPDLDQTDDHRNVGEADEEEDEGGEARAAGGVMLRPGLPFGPTVLAEGLFVQAELGVRALAFISA